MAKLKILAAVLLATSAISAPAMARVHHRPHRIVIDAEATPPGAIYLNGRSCVPAPRVGAFATAPWGNDNIPCEPYGYYGNGGGYGAYNWDY